MSTNNTNTSDAYEAAHRYVEFVATYGPERFRLRKLRRDEQGHDPKTDVINIATERVGPGRVPHFIDSPDRWPIFQHPPTDSRSIYLAHKALNTARKQVVKRIRKTGGPKPGEAVDQEAEVRLARFTEFGQPRMNEPSVVLERGGDPEHAFVDEKKRYDRERDEYEAVQQKRKTAKARDKHSLAVNLLRRGLSFEEIGKLTATKPDGKGGISEQILSPHYRALTEMRNRHLQALKEIEARSLLAVLPAAGAEADPEESPEVAPWDEYSSLDAFSAGEHLKDSADEANRRVQTHKPLTDVRWNELPGPKVLPFGQDALDRGYESYGRRLTAGRLRYQSPAPPFHPGDAVQHPTYGFCIVLRRGGDESSPTVQLGCQDGGTRWETVSAVKLVTPFGDPQAELDQLCETSGMSLDELLGKEDPA